MMFSIMYTTGWQQGGGLSSDMPTPSSKIYFLCCFWECILLLVLTLIAKIMKIGFLDKQMYFFLDLLYGIETYLFLVSLAILFFITLEKDKAVFRSSKRLNPAIAEENKIKLYTSKPLSSRMIAIIREGNHERLYRAKPLGFGRSFFSVMLGIFSGSVLWFFLFHIGVISNFFGFL